MQNYKHYILFTKSLNSKGTAVSDNSITRVTPTSSDQRIDVDYEGDPDHEQSQDMITDNDEEVIVDNTDDEDFMKKKKLMINRDDKNK